MTYVLWRRDKAIVGNYSFEKFYMIFEAREVDVEKMSTNSRGQNFHSQDHRRRI